MSDAATAAPRRPGRPASGARDRILEAAIEVLKAEGYAGLSLAKVAARAGEGKGLVSYHFGSKQGLIAAAGRELGAIITERILGGVDGAGTVEEILRGALDGAWDLLNRDDRLPRVYFDLNAVSVVDHEIRVVMQEVKGGFRRVLIGLVRDADDPVEARDAPDLAVLIIAGIEGLCLEWIERGDTAELGRARERFVRSILAGIS